jgi:predicted DNA-binding transcriptional regulator AlpA
VTDATKDGTLRIAPLWSVEDVAAYLRVPVQTVYSWRAKGTGPRARRVGKYLRYRPEDVIAWFDGPDAGVA